MADITAVITIAISIAIMIHSGIHHGINFFNHQVTKAYPEYKDSDLLKHEAREYRKNTAMRYFILMAATGFAFYEGHHYGFAFLYVAIFATASVLTQRKMIKEF